MHGIRVFLRLLPFLIAFLRDRRRFIVVGRAARRSAAHHEARAIRFTRTLAELGPTFIKLAQVFGARADILPEPYLGAISTLSDQVPPLAPGVAEAVVEAELGETVATAFQRFDTQPLAAASLGQVHRASLDGREVVVKILRPGVEELVQKDLDVSFKILFVLNVLFPNHHTRAITTIVTEFAKRIGEELDFEKEARNAELLRRNFEPDPRVRVPEVLGAMTRRRVLVLEYIEGTRIDRLSERFASGELSFDAVMTTIIEAYIRMMLQDGIFHADPHPGNLLVDTEGRLVLLDFGMVLRVEQETRVRLVRTIVAAVRQDVDGVINGFYELGILDPEVDRGTVRDAARQLMSVSFRDEMSPRQIQRIVEQVLTTFYDWPLMLPSDLVYFGRAAVLVEGIAVRYRPDFNPLAIARPIVARYTERLVQGSLAQDPKKVVADWGLEAASALRTMKDLVRRIEREELRVRWHPRDTLELQRFLGQQVRRGLLALFAFTVAVISSVLYLATQRAMILVVGLVLSFGMFLIILVLPSHLFQNPLRFRRRWPDR